MAPALRLWLLSRRGKLKRHSDPPTDSTPIVKTAYFSWEGDACRQHNHESHRETAHLYRGGLGLLPIHPVDLTWSALEISEHAYRDMVAWEDADYARQVKSRHGGGLSRGREGASLPAPRRSRGSPR